MTEPSQQEILSTSIASHMAEVHRMCEEHDIMLVATFVAPALESKIEKHKYDFITSQYIAGFGNAIVVPQYVIHMIREMFSDKVLDDDEKRLLQCLEEYVVLDTDNK